jgi:hypothetical protein
VLLLEEEMAPLRYENVAMRDEFAELNELLKQQGLYDDDAGRLRENSRCSPTIFVKSVKNSSIITV